MKNDILFNYLYSQAYNLEKPLSVTIEDTRLLLDLLEEARPMVEFDPVIFKSMIQKIIIYPEKFCFCLINGVVLDEGRC